MMPVAKISDSFQLSGRGEGFTLSLDIVIMVPDDIMGELISFKKKEAIVRKKTQYKTL